MRKSQIKEFGSDLDFSKYMYERSLGDEGYDCTFVCNNMEAVRMLKDFINLDYDSKSGVPLDIKYIEMCDPEFSEKGDLYSIWLGRSMGLWIEQLEADKNVDDFSEMDEVYVRPEYYEWVMSRVDSHVDVYCVIYDGEEFEIPQDEQYVGNIELSPSGFSVTNKEDDCKCCVNVKFVGPVDEKAMNNLIEDVVYTFFDGDEISAYPKLER